jgi:uncharacterized membrane protein YbhN (UPF0104 family)
MDAVTRKRPTLWIELGTLVIAGTALLFVFRRVDLKELGHTLRDAHIGWLIASIVSYGIVFPPSAWRWHLMLRLTGNAVHFGATSAMTLIGHFFYTVFFGVAGGDFAKSALYAKWYQLPLSEILAAAPLDRLLGFGGLFLFALISFVLAAWNGAFVEMHPGSLHLPLGWMAAALVLIVSVWIAFKRFGRGQGTSRWLNALRSSFTQMAVSRGIVVQALVCGFLVQIGLAGSLALALQAVSRTHIPWGPLLWTFPVICIVGAIPVSVAGLGFREGAALGLLGLYGISPADAVAASLLTLVGRLAWAVVGGIVLWRDRRLQLDKLPLPKTLSVVVPTLNDAEGLPEVIHRIRTVPEVTEIIVVDGSSTDETRTVAARMGCKVLQGPAGLTGRLRLGASQTTGDAVLFLHADTWLSPNAGKAAINCLRDVQVAGGGFLKKFRDATPLLHGSRLRCAIRFYFGRCILADQGMFFRREVLESIGGVPDVPLREEFELCRRVRKIGKLALAESTVTASAPHSTASGGFQSRLIRLLTCGGRLSTRPHELRKMHEKT